MHGAFTPHQHEPGEAGAEVATEAECPREVPGSVGWQRALVEDLHMT